MRREGGIKTYGRHRSRVIVSDIWLSDSGGKNIFGTSSGNDSSKQSIFHISSSSSERNSPSLNSSDNFTDPSHGRENRKRLTRQKKNAVKENVDLSKKKTVPVPSTKSITSRGKASNSYLFRDSSDTSHSFSINKSERIQLSESGNSSSRVLRSRGETNTGNASGNFQKPLPSTAAKRKRPVRKNNVKPNAKELSVNFSDFDDYSLVIQETSTEGKNDKGCVETSSPLAKRTRKTPYNLIKHADISHIEVVVSPSSDTCYTSLETPYSLQDNDSNITEDLHSSPSLVHLTNKVTGDTNTEQRTPECVVLLKKMTDSFLEKYTHSGRAGKKVLHDTDDEVNGSVSLFSTPGDSVRDDIRFLTSRIQLSYIEHSSEEAEKEEDEYSDYEEEEEGEEDDEVEERLDVLIETDENSTDNDEEEEDVLKDQPEPLSSLRVTRQTRNIVNKAAQLSNDNVEDIHDVDGEEETEEDIIVCSDDEEDVSDESQDVLIETDENSTDEEEEDVLKDQPEPLSSLRVTRQTRNIVNKAAQLSNDNVEDIHDVDGTEEDIIVCSDDEEDVSDESQDVLIETDENSTDEEEEDVLKDQPEPLSSLRVTRQTRNIVNKAAQLSNDNVEDIHDVDGEEETEEDIIVCSDDEEDVSDESQDVFKLNLRKLNRSLQNNQISSRNRVYIRNKTTESDPQEESSNTSGMETSESGTSLYMINEKYDDDVNGKINCSEELFSDSSRYETARSLDIRNSHGRRADDDSDDNLTDRNDNNAVRNDDDSDDDNSDSDDDDSDDNYSDSNDKNSDDDSSDSNDKNSDDDNSDSSDKNSDDDSSDSNDKNSDDDNSDSSDDASNNDGDDEYYSAKETSSRGSLEKEKSSPAKRKFSFKDRFDSSPAKRKFSFTDRFDSLKNSFLEMLTPKKNKGSLVPIPARSKVMVLCDQTDPISFIEALTRPVLNKCKKIGEGVYGEVFRSSSNKQSIAIKIIPIEGDFLVNDEPQKKFEEILPEIVIAKELSDLRFSSTCFTTSFCEVNSVSCVQGKYPAGLLKQWDVYHKAKRSENDRPDVFKEDQLYIVFEFADCGTALESYKPDNLQQSKSILSQVTFALAVAEEALQFEHRDLHWGNVLIRPTDQEEMVFQVTGQEFRVPTMGIEANVIDYTLSRLTKDGCKVYSDLSKDDALFQGKGDYQFDIYRKMKEANGNDWEKFCSYTNVLWLHYLADKLVYRNNTSLNSREERDMLRQFRQFLSQMLNYDSSTEMAVDALFLNS